MYIYIYIYICLKLVYTVYPLNCHFDREIMPGLIKYVWVQVVLGQVATSFFLQQARSDLDAFPESGMTPTIY